MAWNFARRLKRGLMRGTGKLSRDESGNILIMVAAALIPLIGLVGSGVDIARAYMAQLRLQQACDAGVLAGRRAMAAGQWTTDTEEAAQNMFTFNYPDDMYGSSRVNFVPTAVNASNVTGTATAYLPTVLMHIFPFGKLGFDLSVECGAQMEIANTDVMLVLDVTGSMEYYPNNNNKAPVGSQRMDALRTAAMDFFDTITSAALVGDGRLRIGMVPYNSMANVGEILLARDRSWILDHSVISSRTPRMYYYWADENDRNAVKSVTVPPLNQGNWENLLIDSSATDSTSCGNRPVPAITFATTATAVNAHMAGRPFSRTTETTTSSGNLSATPITEAGRTHRYHDYKYSWSGGACWLQRRQNEVTLSRSIAAPKSVAFRDYMYENRVLDVRAIKNVFTATRDATTGAETYNNTGRITVNSAANGGNHSNIPWTGCVMERQTTPVTSGNGAPSGTLDLNVDIAPSNAASRWMMIFPNYTYSRNREISNAPTSLTPSATSSIYPKFGKPVSGETDNSAWGNCPAAAKKLRTMTAADKAIFQGWVDSLIPVGGTYHDAGLVWGLRLLSQDGLFADENSAAPNSRPIGRHIIFMTDGQQDARTTILSHQGYEAVDRRVSGSSSTSDADMKAKHLARFSALCDIAPSKNITIWVITFAQTSDSAVTDCATAGKLYVTQTREQLIKAFNDIAGQISRLRLAR